MEFLSLSDTVQKIKSKKVSPREVVQFFLKKIEKHQPQLKAFITVNEKALKRSEQVDLQGTLAGIPLGIKDMFCTKGLRTTAASKILENYIPPYSATAVCRVEQEGGLVLGKCNQDEFAMGSQGRHSHFGAVGNPWNEDCVAGGSSSGSASAVAGGLCLGALGTDTGGSVRLPAHYCNLVGIKPSYGRVSRYGMLAYASSLDQAGTLTHTVEDGALLLDAITGTDCQDSTTADLAPTQFHQNLNPQIKGKKLAYFESVFEEEGLHEDVRESQKNLLQFLKSQGCQLIPKQWPFLKLGTSVYYLISTSEASSNLSRYDGVRYGLRSSKTPKNLSEFYQNNRGEGFGFEVKRRILMGTFCLSTGYYDEYFHKACQVRSLIKEAFDQIFKDCDAIVCPVSQSPAPLIQAKSSLLNVYLQDQFTVFANLIGAPALSVPVHFSKDNMPIGTQFIGAPFQEQNILDLAFAVEKEFQMHKKRPHGF